MEQIKKSAIYGEYIIQVKENGSIEVFRIYNNVKGALREVAEKSGFTYDPNWTTRQFGNKLIKEFGENKMATIGEYVITEKTDGGIEAYKTYDNIKGALREISEKSGFTYDPEWTTRQFGNKLIDYINQNK